MSYKIDIILKCHSVCDSTTMDRQEICPSEEIL